MMTKAGGSLGRAWSSVPAHGAEAWRQRSGNLPPRRAITSWWEAPLTQPIAPATERPIGVAPSD